MARAKTFSADMSTWSDKAVRNGRLVLLEASSKVFSEMTTRQPSIKETGYFEVGKVPVDLGGLIGSVMVGVSGAEQNTDNYLGVVAGFKPGDTITAAFTAEYAPHIEYGTVNMPGRFMVRTAVRQWKRFVDEAAKRYV